MAVRELLGIAVPTALGNLCEYLPVAIGMAIVGRREGADALAAVALARAYFNVTAMAVGFGLVSALRTLCPQAVGAGRPELCATTRSARACSSSRAARRAARCSSSRAARCARSASPRTSRRSRSRTACACAARTSA